MQISGFSLYSYMERARNWIIIILDQICTILIADKHIAATNVGMSHYLFFNPDFSIRLQTIAQDNSVPF